MRLPRNVIINKKLKLKLRQLKMQNLFDRSYQTRLVNIPIAS